MSPSAVPSGRMICQSALAPGSSLPAHLGTAECSAGQGHDAPVALGCLSELERWRESRVQPVDLGQARFGKMTAHGWFLAATGRPLLGRRIIRMGLQRGNRDAHPVVERQRAQQAV